MTLVTRVLLLCAVCVGALAIACGGVDSITAPLDTVCYRLVNDGVPLWEATLSTRFPRLAFSDAVTVRQQTNTPLHNCAIASVQRLADDGAQWLDVNPHASALFSTDATRTLFFGPINALNYQSALSLSSRILRIQIACTGFYAPISERTSGHMLIALRYTDELVGDVPVLRRVALAAAASSSVRNSVRRFVADGAALDVECVGELYRRVSRCITQAAPSASATPSSTRSASATPGPLFTQYYARLVLTGSHASPPSVALQFYFASAREGDSQACDAVLSDASTGAILRTLHVHTAAAFRTDLRRRSHGDSIMQAVAAQVVRVIDLRWEDGGGAECTVVVLRDGTLSVRHAQAYYGSTLYDSVALDASLLQASASTHELQCIMPSASPSPTPSVSASMVPRCRIEPPRVVSLRTHLYSAATQHSIVFYTETALERNVCNDGALELITITGQCQYVEYEGAVGEDLALSQCSVCSVSVHSTTALVCGELTFDLALVDDVITAVVTSTKAQYTVVRSDVERMRDFEMCETACQS